MVNTLNTSRRSGDKKRSSDGRGFLAWVLVLLFICLVGIKMSSISLKNLQGGLLEQHSTEYRTAKSDPIVPSPKYSNMTANTTMESDFPPSKMYPNETTAPTKVPIMLGSNDTGLVAFERQEGVVIVTKIHGPNQKVLMDQSLCLLHHAYNHKPLYDIVVFTAEPLSDEDTEFVTSLVAPANITIVVDNRGFQEEVAALSPDRRKNFLDSCGVSTPENLTWWSECPGRVAYNWQAEFRSWQIWKHPAIASYKYMMWLDSDGFSTKIWPQDPIKTMIENDLVILFDNWPQGAISGADVTERIRKAFDVQLCKLSLVGGHFESQLGPGDGSTCSTGRFGLVHGFFHITNLDFFRSEAVQRWAEIWIGDGFLQRRYDDQAGVTVPSAVLAPNRSWDMRSKGIKLDIYHNSALDGKGNEKAGGFFTYWRTTVKEQLPTADGVCPIKARN